MDTTLIPQPPASTVSPHEVEEQLQRLLASPLFSHSRRYPGFLQYVVDEALKGHQEHLKERSIGIDVFHRTPDYDLNTDPVVRVTAGEVRKRLAQYYYEADHQDELRIELKPGSYVPEFKLVPDRPRPLRDSHSDTSTTSEIEPTHDPVGPVSALVSEPLAAAPVPIGTKTRRSFLGRRWLAISLACGCLALAAAICMAAYLSRSPSALDSFWRPIVKSNALVLISVGSWKTSSVDNVSIGTHAKSSDPVALSDTVTIASIQQLLSQHAKASQIQSSAQTTFSDLQRGPTILISGFDNPWTMRLTDPLRFHFLAKTPDVLAIEDRNNPANSEWQIDTQIPYAQLTKDYGIVARFHDPTTDQLIVVAAGIGENGTLAAGQMLTSEQFLREAEKSASWSKSYQNIEAVVETLVIDGKSGPPHVVAWTTW